MENKNLEKTNSLETPCFVVDDNKFINNIKRFFNALNSVYKNNIISYSVKTNSLPHLLRLAKEQECYCEVVSFDEFELAKRVGFEIDHIIYNGPLKSKETFIEAINGGAIVNIETYREIDWLINLGKKPKCNIGLRLNIDLTIISPEDAKPGEGESRFGFDFSNGEFQKAYYKLKENGIQINGLHVHRTSYTRSLRVYKNICKYASKVINELNLRLSYFDIGGGFFGDFPGKPDYSEYVNAIAETLDVNPDVTIIVEPGNGLVASTVKFVTSVIEQKKIGKEAIIGIDGNRFDIDPFFKKNNYNYEIITDNESNKKIGKQKIVGCTCLENDVITVLENEKPLKIGDKLIFLDQGAYTMTLTPNFIRLVPNVYSQFNESYKMIRNKLDVREWMSNSLLTHSKDTKAILFSNAGRRAKLIKDFKESIGRYVKMIATDNWCVAPALFVADEYYITPKINEIDYIDKLIEICRKENVKAITTCIDPEIEILAKNRTKFIDNGILPLCPDQKTAELCFDKYKMYQYLIEKNIKTVLTFDNIKSFENAYRAKEIDFPVFVKPRCGSGSVGIAKANSEEELYNITNKSKGYIIQEYMDCLDFDADVYVDTISNEAVAAFAKKKIENRVGGASKTISFKDERLFVFIKEIVKNFKFYGPIDMDFFFKDGVYYLSEINPRFGGAYLHAFGAGVDFTKLILNNIKGIKNPVNIGDYNEDVLMMMYDDVIITTKDQLRGDYND